MTVADQRSRDGERRWQGSASIEASAALVADRLRRGVIRVERVQAAAFLGFEGAGEIAAPPWPQPMNGDVHTQRLQRVLELGVDDLLLREWACRCADRVLHWYEHRNATDVRPRQAIAVARAESLDVPQLEAASREAYRAAEGVSHDLAAWSAAQAAGAAARPLLREVLPLYAAHDAQVAGTGRKVARWIEVRWQLLALIELLLAFPQGVLSAQLPPQVPATSPRARIGTSLELFPGS